MLTASAIPRQRCVAVSTRSWILTIPAACRRLKLSQDQKGRNTDPIRSAGRFSSFCAHHSLGTPSLRLLAKKKPLLRARVYPFVAITLFPNAPGGFGILL